MPEPTSVLPPPAARPLAASPSVASPIADGLPDPATLEDAAPAALSPGDADDLIAKLADEQIDRLLAEDDHGTPEPAATSQPPSIPEPNVTPAPFVERRQAAPDAPVSFPASFSPRTTKPAEPDVPLATATSADVFSSTPLATPLASSVDAPELPVDAHDALRSDAAAVAQELSDDLARSPQRVAAPPPPPLPPAGVAHGDASAIGRAVHAIGVVPTAIVDVINLPVRGADDNAREAIGAIAIVTLANAAALLLYLMIFR